MQSHKERSGGKITQISSVFEGRTCGGSNVAE